MYLINYIAYELQLWYKVIISKEIYRVQFPLILAEAGVCYLHHSNAVSAPFRILWRTTCTIQNPQPHHLHYNHYVTLALCSFDSGLVEYSVDRKSLFSTEGGLRLVK